MLLKTIGGLLGAGEGGRREEASGCFDHPEMTGGCRNGTWCEDYY